MDIFIFVYNILLLMLYVVISTLSFTVYIKKKNILYAAIGILFLVNICDNTIIYMTEFIDWFYSTYNTQFMTIPAFKTIILLMYSSNILFICNTVLKRKTSFSGYIVLLAQGLILMFTPMMPNSAYKVWLYYLPCQLFQIWLSLYGLNIIKQNPDDYNSTYYDNFKKILKITFVFALFILVEDTIVIFNYDNYSKLIVRINNRNICEDILSMLYCYFILRYYWSLMEKGVKENIPVIPTISADPEMVATTAEPLILPKPTPPTLVELFCKEYNLTVRETEIFTLLIKSMSNQDICEELMISIGTVKTHVHNIFNKLGVSKRSQVLNVYQEFVLKDET